MQIYSLFKSGFISIVGCPNAGKSTLINLLIGSRLSIVSPKVQTTRHRIMGIFNDSQSQLIFLDTPGILKPRYKLQEHMMQTVEDSLKDADVIVLVTGPEPSLLPEPDFLKALQVLNKPLVIVYNKIDQLQESQMMEGLAYWKQQFPESACLPLSALHAFNHPALLNELKQLVPEHPPYYDSEALTDRSERFIASEYIREVVFARYHKEIPYSTEITIDEFKTSPKGLHLHATVWVERETQKGILIGHGGKALKQLGSSARKQLELFFNAIVHLKLHVKVEPDWRSRDQKLKQWGY